MELKRDIYLKLLDWKKKNSHKVLELEGARQVGKTLDWTHGICNR